MESMENKYRYYHSYRWMLLNLNFNLINSFLLRDDSVIEELNNIVNGNILIHYLILLQNFGENNQLVSAFEYAICLTKYLFNKYNSKELNITTIQQAYYSFERKIEDLNQNINEKLFLDNNVHQQHKKDIIELIEYTLRRIEDLYKNINSSMRNTYELIDKSIEFILENKNKIYNNKVFYKDNNIARKEIFISYTHKDESLVHSIKDNFKLSNLNVWFDEEKIRPAQLINEEIIKGIEDSDYFLLFDSKNSRESKYVTEEINYAVENFKKLNKPKIISILIDDIKPRMDIEKLENIKGIIFDDIKKCVNEIYKAIDAKCIEIHPIEFNTLITLIQDFVSKVNYTNADPNLALGEGDFEAFVTFEYTINNKWLMYAEEIEDSFIGESNNIIGYDWEFYNSDRVTCIGAFKINIVLKLLDKIINNCGEEIYKKYLTHIN